MNQKPLVISIAAVSGGGKTTITDQLVNRLHNAKALYFDEYEFEECPKDINEWVDNGADYNEWNLTPLIKDIQHLFTNRDEFLDYIFLDYPFAYLNKKMRGYIDFTLYIDTPLDIAMARRILRDHAASPLKKIRNDLTHYLSRGRAAYLNMEETVKPNSDVIIDGSLPVNVIVDEILVAIRKKVNRLY